MSQQSKEFIRKIILEGSKAEKLELYGFFSNTPRRIIANKFRYFARGNYPRYFKDASAPFHDDLIMDMISSYFGENVCEIVFRGGAKTSLKKLFDCFVILNDKDHFRKYIKVNTLDLKNSVQIVTDVYNLMVEVVDIYGDQFEKDGDKKREETMKSFTTRSGIKYTAGTVGQTQRGHLQDSNRPDWIWFDDTEDSKSITSQTITQSTIATIEEAIKGLSRDGSCFATANYISDQGVVQNFINKPSFRTRITPLLKDDKDDSSATWQIYTPEMVRKLRDDCKSSPEGDWFGEYQCDPKRSENKFFDVERMDADLRLCEPPKRVSAGVRYWGNYQPHHRYGCGADFSEGIGRDSNTLCLFDFTTGELIATYANNTIAPDLFANELCRVGAEFGNCLLIPEINASCGGIAITTIRGLGYPNIFQQVDETKVKNQQSIKFGWSTNSKTKYNAMFEFRRDYQDGLIKIRDRDALAEMKAYTNNDLNETNTGIITRHFDILLSMVLGWQGRKLALASSGNKETYSNAYKKYIESI